MFPHVFFRIKLCFIHKLTQKYNESVLRALLGLAGSQNRLNPYTRHTTGCAPAFYLVKLLKEQGNKVKKVFAPCLLKRQMEL